MSNQLNDRKGKVMKKLYTMMMMAVMGLMTISLTSCEDERIANTLEGTWKGSRIPAVTQAAADTGWTTTAMPLGTM